MDIFDVLYERLFLSSDLLALSELRALARSEDSHVRQASIETLQVVRGWVEERVGMTGSGLMKLTKIQDEMLWRVANGMILRRAGHGFEWIRDDGVWFGKASITAKNLIGAKPPLLAEIDNKRVYLTTEEWKVLFPDYLPVDGEAAEFTAMADHNAEIISSMLDDDDEQNEFNDYDGER